MPAGIRWGMSSTDSIQNLQCLIVRLREQARSHKVYVDHKFCEQPEPHVGAGLLAKGPAATSEILS